MYAMDVVKLAAANSGVSMYSIAHGMGVTPQSMATTAGRGSNPRADTLARMLEQANYSLCAVPSDNVPDDAIIID